MRDGAEELLVIFAVHGSVIASLRAENERLARQVADLHRQMEQLASQRAASDAATG